MKCDSHKPLNVLNTEDDSEIVKFKLTKDHINVIDALEAQFKADNQMLLFPHGAARTGKSHATRKIKKIVEHEGIFLIVYLTGISDTLIDGGTTDVHTFRLKLIM